MSYLSLGLVETTHKIADVYATTAKTLRLTGKVKMARTVRIELT